MADENKAAWHVVKTIPENKDVTSVVIAPGTGAAPPHRAGQFASIRIMTENGWSEPHPFTISCDAQSPEYRFTIKNVGDFTGGVRNWRPGDPVQCSGPAGAFCKDIEHKKNIVMIAGGVGITPFLSVLRTFRKERASNKVFLFWSNKTLEDAFARHELHEMTGELNLVIVHVLSREKRLDAPPPFDNVHVVLGRLTREIFEQFDFKQDSSFYVCGPPAMQEAMLTVLQSCGVSPDAVEQEYFSFAAPRK